MDRSQNGRLLSFIAVLLVVTPHLHNTETDHNKSNLNQTP